MQLFVCATNWRSTLLLSCSPIICSCILICVHSIPAASSRCCIWISLLSRHIHILNWSAHITFVTHLLGDFHSLCLHLIWTHPAATSSKFIGNCLRFGSL